MVIKNLNIVCLKMQMTRKLIENNINNRKAYAIEISRTKEGKKGSQNRIQEEETVRTNTEFERGRSNEVVYL